VGFKIKKMKEKNLLKWLFLGILVVVLGGVVFVLGRISGEKTQSRKAASLVIPGYQLAEIEGAPAEYVVDLKNQGEKRQLVRVYTENKETKTLPVIIKVFSLGKDGFKEEFKFEAKFPGKAKPPFDVANQLEEVKVEKNFWGDGRTVVFFSLFSNYYGSGGKNYLIFLSYKEGRYQVVQGPVLDELADYRFTGKNGKGEELVVAKAVWNTEEEGHFSPHRYTLEHWIWNENSYEKAGLERTTENKYDPASNVLDQIIQKEPHLL